MNIQIVEQNKMALWRQDKGKVKGGPNQAPLP